MKKQLFNDLYRKMDFFLWKKWQHLYGNNKHLEQVDEEVTILLPIKKMIYNQSLLEICK